MMKEEPDDNAEKPVDVNEEENSDGHGSHGHGASFSCSLVGCLKYPYGKGIIEDIKRKFGGKPPNNPWVSEMTNFSQQTVAVSFFIFFAAISPAITFGAIYAKATDNWMGAVEMITATAWCGIAYALIGGQPMMINGGTGPVLAFSEILYKMSKTMDVPFLSFNAWVGLWVALFMVIAALVDLNDKVIIYATRFTDEIFALLIAAIFIINACGNPFGSTGIYYYFTPDHISHQRNEAESDGEYNYLASAFLSFIICIGTVQLAFMLRTAKFSSFGPNQTMRNVVTDFAVVLSIAIMTIIDQVIFPSVQTETLNVPDVFAPTFICCDPNDCAFGGGYPIDCPDLVITNEESLGQRRPWVVNPFDLNGKTYVPFIAAIPAILAFILVFLDDGITWHLINHPSHKLKHGEAYNYDTLVIGIMVAVNSMLGLPWLVAATVRSLNHVHALAEKSPSGRILSVRETRLTHLGIHLLCFASIFALNVLKVIPMPVLYGVFLFMGLVSLGTNQFWMRVQMFFMQPTKFPLEPFTKYVSTNRMRLFTLLQCGLFLMLYIVKSIKSIAIAFPIIIALCIPFRMFVLTKIFTEEELIMIDTDDDTIKKYIMKKEKEQEEKEAAEQDADAEEGGNIEKVEEEEDDDDEGGDIVSDLPVVRRRSNPTKRNRKKSTSCPTGMLFAIEDDEQSNTANSVDDSENTADAPKRRRSFELGGATVVPLGQRMAMMDAAEAQVQAQQVQQLQQSGTQDDLQPRRRPRYNRQKSLSCQPHMLFKEAQRHVDQQYFFG